MIRLIIRYNFTSISSIFRNRDLLYQCTSSRLIDQNSISQMKGKCVYCGYDPTASSLHLGNLVSILMMIRMNLYGIRPIFVLGGATGLIGDPSGKKKQRPLIDVTTLDNNLSSIQEQIKQLCTKIHSDIKNNYQQYDITDQQLQNIQQYPYKIINNAKFYTSLNAIQFLRDIGKHFRMSYLLNKDSVAQRLHSQEGLSYTEFSYSIIQAYDFFKLWETEQCMLQIGGSDQWGNITNGLDLVRKLGSGQVYGITMPLLVGKNGEKFGKSAGNALYLSQKLTPIGQIYQYFYNTTDNNIINLLRIFTFLKEQDIQNIFTDTKKQIRKGQQILAEKVVNYLGNYQNPKKQLYKLSPIELKNKSEYFFKNLFNHIKEYDYELYFQIILNDINNNDKIWDFFIKNCLSNSKKQIRRQLENKSIYINNQQINQLLINVNMKKIITKQIIHNKFLIIRRGKKKYQFLYFI